MGINKPQIVLFFIVLILAIYVIWKNYWRVQMIYNNSILTFYTPDTFSINPLYKKELYRITQKGFSSMKNKKVVICVLLRDAAVKIKEIKKRAERVGNMFGDYRIIVVENDSKDDTRLLLKKWRDLNPRVIILGCGINSDANVCNLPKASIKTEGHSVDRGRIEKMAHLRNIYLDYVKNNLYYYDFAIVWDMDIVGTVYLDGIANTIGQFSENPQNIDAICAYGIYRWGFLKLYYDTYAHIDNGDSFHIDLKTIHDLKKGFGVQCQRGEPLLPVTSCFGGFTIYKISTLRDPKVKYSMSPPDNLECEHVRFHRHMSKVFLNPSMVNFVLVND